MKKQKKKQSEGLAWPLKQLALMPVFILLTEQCIKPNNNNDNNNNNTVNNSVSLQLMQLAYSCFKLLYCPNGKGHNNQNQSQNQFSSDVVTMDTRKE